MGIDTRVIKCKTCTSGSFIEYIDEQNRGKTSSYPEKNMDNVYISSTYNELWFIIRFKLTKIENHETYNNTCTDYTAPHNELHK